jgi:hypothetical protein
MDTLSKSFNLLKKNLVLYVPDIGYSVINYILLLCLSLYLGLDFLTFITGFENELGSMLGVYIEENLAQLIISGLIFFVIAFIIGVGVDVIRYSMIKDVLNKKKIVIGRIWKEKKQFFWSVVFFKVLTFLVVFAMLLVVAAIGGLIFFLFSFVDPLTGTVSSIVLGLLLSFVGLIFIKLALLFGYPIMFLGKNKNPLKVLKASFKFFKKRKEYVFVTLLVTIGIGVVIGILSFLVNLLFSFDSFIPGLLILLTIVSIIINFIISVTGKLWIDIYLFSRYKERP